MHDFSSFFAKFHFDMNTAFDEPKGILPDAPANWKTLFLSEDIYPGYDFPAPNGGFTGNHKRDYYVSIEQKAKDLRMGKKGKALIVPGGFADVNWRRRCWEVNQYEHEKRIWEEHNLEMRLWRLERLAVRAGCENVGSEEDGSSLRVRLRKLEALARQEDSESGEDSGSEEDGESEEDSGSDEDGDSFKMRLERLEAMEERDREDDGSSEEGSGSDDDSGSDPGDFPEHLFEQEDIEGCTVEKQGKKFVVKRR